jgi:hypothetical protein
VHLHGGLGAVLQAAHVAQHPLDVFEHVTRSHAQHVAFTPLFDVGLDGPLVQRVDPFLHCGALVFAGVFQQMQRIA